MTKPNLTDDQIDHALATEDAIVPTSGFSARVMARVHKTVAAPPPIPFPWMRALPGFAAILVAAVMAAGADAPSQPAVTLTLPPMSEPISLAVGVALGSLAMSFAVIQATRLIGVRRAS
jgi:hypothetical protein